MNEFSIKVTIAGRIYPITVTSQEEDKVRAAAQKLEENLKLLQSNYAVKDKQDLLAMTALQFATQASQEPAHGEVIVKLSEIDALESAIQQL